MRVIVVLGMHRSGTSVVTCGLKALGVDLGKNLLPPQPDNPKGFWEDVGLLAINDKLLASCGLVWHSFGGIEKRLWDSPELKLIRLEAIEYIRRHFAKSPVWAFKDPRTARLLPFWKSVFVHLDIADSYVINIRNPISVAKSLEVRNGFPAEKSHLLWLDHVVSSVRNTSGKQTVVVDYDEMLASPENQLKRIGRALDLLRGTKNKADIAVFAKQFVTPDLRHNHFVPEELRLDPSINGLTRTAYELLLMRAKDEVGTENTEYQEGWNQVDNTYSSIQPIFHYLEKVSVDYWNALASNQANSVQIASLNVSVAQRDQQFASPHKDLGERDSRLSDLGAQLTERDQQLAALQEATVQREQQIATLHQELGERDNRLNELQGRLTERDQQLAALQEATVQRDQKINGLHQELGDRDSRLGELNAQLVEHKRQVADLHAVVARHDQQLAQFNEVVLQRDQQLTEAGTRLTERDQQLAALQEATVQRDQKIAGLSDLLSTRGTELQYAVNELKQANVEIASAKSEIESGRKDLESERSANEYYKSQNQGLLMKVFTHEHESRTVGMGLGRLINRFDAWILPQHTLRGRLAHLMRKTVEVSFDRGIVATYELSKKHLLNWLRYRFRRGLHPSPVGYLQHATPPELERWMVAAEPKVEALQRQARHHFRYSPLISVILPVYKVPAEVLEKTLRSLINQTYANWEACVAYADVGNDENWNLISRLAQEDVRIRGERLEMNGGISINSNAALLLARGEFVALLDHDDELTPWAFHAMVECLNKDPEIDFLYSDKDCIDEHGTLRLNALFKPEWSPEILYSVNYLTHLCLMRKRLVDDVGGWRPETDGAQDWDIFYRVTERSRKVTRVPGIHYHWRIISTSTSTGLTAKPYAALGQLRTQQDRIARLGLPATVFPHPESGFHVVWDTARLAGVDVIVDGDVPEAQLRQFLPQLWLNQGVLLASVKVLCREGTDKSMFDGLPQQVGFISYIGGDKEKARAMIDASEGTGQVLMFLSASIGRLGQNCLLDLAGWAGCHPEIAFAGALALLEDETVAEAGLILNSAGEGYPFFRGTPLRSWGWLGGSLWYRNCSAVSPSAVAFKRSVWQSMDPLPIKAGDNWRAEFLHRCRVATNSHYRGMVDPHARIYLASMPAESLPVWEDSFRSDPYFHPAFSSVSPLKLQA